MCCYLSYLQQDTSKNLEKYNPQIYSLLLNTEFKVAANPVRLPVVWKLCRF